MVASVWYGNDDSSETNNMTGGSLPAMTWKEIMGFAHQGLEIKPLPGLQPDPAQPKPALVAAAPAGAVPGAAPAPQTVGYMSRRTFEVVNTLGSTFRSLELSGGRGAIQPVPQADAGRRSTVR